MKPDPKPASHRLFRTTQKQPTIAVASITVLLFHSWPKPRAGGTDSVRTFSSQQKPLDVEIHKRNWFFGAWWILDFCRFNSLSKISFVLAIATKHGESTDHKIFLSIPWPSNWAADDVLRFDQRELLPAWCSPFRVWSHLSSMFFQVVVEQPVWKIFVKLGIFPYTFETTTQFSAGSIIKFGCYKFPTESVGSHEHQTISKLTE